jgi:hypothetical protein
MITAYRMEFDKTRRRRIWLIVFLLTATQLAWALWDVHRMNAHQRVDGWLAMLYQFPLLNAIMLPVIVGVIASRLSDIEHKGQTFRLLNTVIPQGRLFAAKFLCGATYTIAISMLQVGAFTGVGLLYGFPQPVPWKQVGLYLLATITVSITILLVQQILSLEFPNQMIALAVGMIGSFAGLFSMFLPEGFQKFLLWSYYGIFLTVRMDYDAIHRIVHYRWVEFDRSGFISLLVMLALIYILGQVLFARREV